MSDPKFTKLLTKRKGELLAGAVHEYNGTKGTLTVGFNENIAYMFVTDDGEIFDLDSVVKLIDKNSSKYSYPNCFDEFVSIAEPYQSNLTPEMKEYYGFTDEIESDIREKVAFLNDKYGGEVPLDLSQMQ